MYLITLPACQRNDTTVTSKSYNTYIKIRKTPKTNKNIEWCYKLNVKFRLLS